MKMKSAVLSLGLLVFFAWCAPASALAPAAAPETAKPLLVIRFNQEPVHFTRALKQAVVNAEHIKAGVQYKVVSYVPSGKRKGQAKVPADRAKKNLESVTAGIQQLGVDTSRIRASSETSDSARSQEIKVFVE